MKTYYVCGTIEVPDSIDIHDLLSNMSEVASDNDANVDFEQVDNITEEENGED